MQRAACVCAVRTALNFASRVLQHWDHQVRALTRRPCVQGTPACRAHLMLQCRKVVMLRRHVVVVLRLSHAVKGRPEPRRQRGLHRRFLLQARTMPISGV